MLFVAGVGPNAGAPWDVAMCFRVSLNCIPVTPEEHCILLSKLPVAVSKKKGHKDQYSIANVDQLLPTLHAYTWIWMSMSGKQGAQLPRMPSQYLGFKENV